MPQTKTRKQSIRYKPLLDLPPLSQEEYDGLRQSIAVNGVLMPILVDCDGPRRRIIDGNHRKKIADDLGYECHEIVHEGDEEELRSLARNLNLARRQLSREQKRAIIADQLRETPDHTDRRIAKMLGVDHKTVAGVRGELVGEIPQLGRRLGRDGKSYKASKARDYWADRPGGVKDPNNPRDFHPTPEIVIAALLKKEKFRGTILEPARGDGAIVRMLRKAGYQVHESDIADGTDFLQAKNRVPNIVTNPPYADGMAERFCRHALTLATRKVAMLLPMWILEGVQRHDLFTKQPLKAIYILSRRPTFGHDQECHAPFGTCWAVWDKTHTGKARIEWILD